MTIFDAFEIPSEFKDSNPINKHVDKKLLQATMLALIDEQGVQ